MGLYKWDGCQNCNNILKMAAKIESKIHIYSVGRIGKKSNNLLNNVLFDVYSLHVFPKDKNIAFKILQTEN